MAVGSSPSNPDQAEPAGVAAPLRVRLAWLAALSFASGFPFGLVNETLPVYLRTHGAGLVEIGLISAVSFPWTFKFIWAPLVDRVGSRRQWIVGCLAGLTLLTLVLGTMELSELARWFWLILVLMVTLSATQDIAIDAYTIEATTTRELGVANSVRIAAYRVAMFTAGGLLIWLAGRQGWPASFLTGATLIGALTAAALFIPEPKRTVATAMSIWEPLRELLSRPGIWAVALFALLFKIDIYAMEPMTRPFWVDRGFTLEEIGAILTPGRIIATVSGAVLGGLAHHPDGDFSGTLDSRHTPGAVESRLCGRRQRSRVEAADHRRGAVRELRPWAGDGGVSGVPDVGLRAALCRDPVRGAVGVAGVEPDAGGRGFGGAGGEHGIWAVLLSDFPSGNSRLCTPSLDQRGKPGR